MWTKIKDFPKQNESKIVLFAGFILVAVLSFEAGIMKGRNMQQTPVIVNENCSQSATEASYKNAPEGQNLSQEASNITAGTSSQSQKCAYVGSKNSNKYHLPTCRWAKNIKPENIVCFKDENEAKLKGYLPDKTCIK